MSRKVLIGQFFDCGVAIIAVVNDEEDATIIDWVAYIGVAENKQDAEQVAETGMKLSHVDAVHFFPSLPVWKLRR